MYSVHVCVHGLAVACRNWNLGLSYVAASQNLRPLHSTTHRASTRVPVKCVVMATGVPGDNKQYVQCTVYIRE